MVELQAIYFKKASKPAQTHYYNWKYINYKVSNILGKYSYVSMCPPKLTAIKGKVVEASYRQRHKTPISIKFIKLSVYFLEHHANINLRLFV